MARILLVEDEVVISMATSMLLEDEGHVVEIAADGAKGLDMAVASPPDIIITDYMMPRLDGLTLIERLRTLGSHVPIILTTSVPESQLPSTYPGGHDCYISKPYVIGQILDAIETLLSSRLS
jgi:CheY-like chemotaxis protein